MWHGYFAVERLNIGILNWQALVGVFNQMGTHDDTLPAHNTHSRTRLDGDAVIYESLFEPDEVSIDQFKELLASIFGLPAEDILNTTEVVDYAGNDTTVWTFYYDEILEGKDRFKVERFGRGGTWQESGDECRAYLALYSDLWEAEELMAITFAVKAKGKLAGWWAAVKRVARRIVRRG